MRGYFDHAATSPMREQVRDAYLEALGVVGNPSSIHSAGQEARALVEGGREAVAAALGADPMETVLTGGGTEAVNLAVKGLYWSAAPRGRRRILLTPAEHHATLDAVRWLQQHQGAEVEWIPVDHLGRISLDALAAAIQRDPASVALVTSLWANNEVGTIQPVAEIVGLAARYGIPVHLDAVSAFGQLPIDAHAVGAAAISVSAHKIGGPVGVGALYLARNAPIEPLLHGGDQQRARSGTMDAAGAHAFGLAAELAVGGPGSPALAEHAAELSALRDQLIAGVLGISYGSGTARPAFLMGSADRPVAPAFGLSSAPPPPVGIRGVVLRGDPDPAGRLPGNAHFTFEGCEGDSLLYLLDQEGFAVSVGSACQAGVPEPSHVLLAMGLAEAEARGALRFTVGAGVTAFQVDGLLGALPAAVERARAAGFAGRAADSAGWAPAAPAPAFSAFPPPAVALQAAPAVPPAPDFSVAPALAFAADPGAAPAFAPADPSAGAAAPPAEPAVAAAPETFRSLSSFFTRPRAAAPEPAAEAVPEAETTAEAEPEKAPEPSFTPDPALAAEPVLEPETDPEPEPVPEAETGFAPVSSFAPEFAPASDMPLAALPLPQFEPAPEPAPAPVYTSPPPPPPLSSFAPTPVPEAALASEPEPEATATAAESEPQTDPDSFFAPGPAPAADLDSWSWFTTEPRSDDPDA